MYPSENAIREVMAKTGMEYLQARNHLIGRYLVLQSLNRRS